MSDSDALRSIVEALTRILYRETRELERFAERVEAATGLAGYSAEFGVHTAELSELLVRVKKLIPASMP